MSRVRYRRARNPNVLEPESGLCKGALYAVAGAGLLALAGALVFVAFACDADMACGPSAVAPPRPATHSKGVTGYNEVIVGRDDYESRLPQAVEAVVFTGDDRSKAEAVHAKFLGAYGLAASQVPLLHVAPVKAWYTQWGIESFEET